MDGAAAAAAAMGGAAARPEAVAVAHAGRCVSQCALWQAREQYDTLLQRPHLELAGTLAHCAHTELMLAMMLSENCEGVERREASALFGCVYILISFAAVFGRLPLSKMSRF